MYNFFFSFKVFKTLLPHRHPSHCVFWTWMRKLPFYRAHSSREFSEGLTLSLLQNCVAGPSTGYRVLNDREDLLRLSWTSFRSLLVKPKTSPLMLCIHILGNTCKLSKVWLVFKQLAEGLKPKVKLLLPKWFLYVYFELRLKSKGIRMEMKLTQSSLGDVLLLT